MPRMETSLHAYVVSRLQSAKGTWPKVAEGSGVPRRTIEKIARGEIRRPNVQSIEQLKAYFDRLVEGHADAP
jgi:predicted transcriptional regulator